MPEQTVYKITAEADAYGPECADPVACAEAIRDKLIAHTRKLAYPLFLVEIVDETESFNKHSTGDATLIAYLDELVKTYWVDWVPWTAFRS